MNKNIVHFSHEGLSVSEYKEKIQEARRFVVSNKLECKEIVDDEMEWLHEGFRFIHDQDMNFFLLMFSNHYKIAL